MSDYENNNNNNKKYSVPKLNACYAVDCSNGVRAPYITYCFVYYGTGNPQ